MSYLTKSELKKQLQDLGILIEGNFVKKSDLKLVLARRDLSHLPVESRVLEITKGVFNWVIRNLHTAETALKPKRKIKQSEMTPEVTKILNEIETVSNKAKQDIEKIRKDLDEFIYKKYGDYLEVGF